MPDVPPTLLNQLATIIAKNLRDEDFYIVLLYSALTTTYTHTYRKIQTTTGFTPSMHISKMRLESTSQLLKTIDFSVGEIVSKVGVSTQAYFSKCFVDWYNTPLLH